MERRKFLKSAGSTAAAALIAPQLSGNQTNGYVSFIQSDSLSNQPVSVSVKNNSVFVETETLSATIEKGVTVFPGGRFPMKSKGETTLRKV